jgi:hypothetical protein
VRNRNGQGSDAQHRRLGLGSLSNASRWRGAALGNKNALKHGLSTAEAMGARRAISVLLRDSRELTSRL